MMDEAVEWWNILSEFRQNKHLVADGLDPKPPIIPLNRLIYEQDLNLPVSRKMSGAKIIRTVAMVTGHSVAAIQAHGRKGAMRNARFAAAWLCKKHCHHLSYPQIAKLLNRDHTSILYAVNRAPDLYRDDKNFRHIILCAEGQLGV